MKHSLSALARNSKGSEILPCGTPDKTGNRVDEAPLIET